MGPFIQNWREHTVIYQLLRRHIAKRLIPGKTSASRRTASSHSRAPQIVLVAGQCVLHHGIADDKTDILGQTQWTILQRAAIEHERVSGLRLAGRELVHNAASSSDKLIFGALAEQSQLNKIDVMACRLEQGVTHRDLEGCRRAEAGPQRNFAPNIKVGPGRR